MDQSVSYDVNTHTNDPDPEEQPQRPTNTKMTNAATLAHILYQKWEDGNLSVKWIDFIQ